MVPEEIMTKCGDLCIAQVTVSVKRTWGVNSKFAHFSLRYFYYPQVKIDVMKPSLGPTSGGNVVKIGLIEPTGPLTRQGSGLESFSKAFDNVLPVSVDFGCNNSENNATSVNITKKEGTKDLRDLNIFELSMLVPPSNSGACVSELKVYIDGVRIIAFNVNKVLIIV